MRTLKALAFVTVGVLVGIGVTLGGQNVRAAQKPTTGRLVSSGTEWAGNYPFRFFRDTKTGQCYLAGLNGPDNGPTSTITAITPTGDPTACSK